MAVTANQLAVALFNAAAGGYKGLIEANQLKNGDVYTANWLLVESGLNNPDTDIFAYVLVDKLVGSTLTSAQKAAGAAEIKYILATNGNSRGDAVLKAINFLSTTTDATYANAKAQYLNKVTTADSYTGSSTNLADLVKVVANVTSAPGTVNVGQTFTLTTATGENIVGTANNDEFRAVADATAASATLNVGDVIDGGAGTDTLNLFVTTSTGLPGGSAIKNVEIINFTQGGAAGAKFTAADLDASKYVGVQQVWQKGYVAADLQTVSKVGDGVTVGIDGTKNATAGTDISLTADFTKATGAFAINGVENTGGAGDDIILTANSTGTLAADATKTLTVGGGVTKDNTGVLIIQDQVAGAPFAASDVVETLKLNLTGEKVTVDVSDLSKLKTLDASGSSNNVTTTVNAGTLTAVTAVKMGSGADTLTLNVGAKNLAVDLGAGNDTLITGATASATNATGTITLGAGKDTVQVVNGLNNVVDAATFEDGLLVVQDFTKGEDTLDFKTAGSATFVKLSAAQLDTAKGKATLKEALNFVETLLTANGQAAVFSYGSDAYVFVEQTNAAAGFGSGDGLIKLVGVDAATLSTDQNGGILN